jgi:hypothetical protein
LIVQRALDRTPSFTVLCSFYDENQTKEEYFRTAGEILKGKEDDYQAFVPSCERLVNLGDRRGSVDCRGQADGRPASDAVRKELR